MKSTNKLEQRISEAVDGLLNARQLEQLRRDLSGYPDLKKELDDQLLGLPLMAAFNDVQPDPFATSRLRHKLKSTPHYDWQFEVLLVFKRYVLATGIASLLLVAAIQAIPQQDPTTDPIEDEISIMFESIESEALDWTPAENGQKP